MKYRAIPELSPSRIKAFLSKIKKRRKNQCWNWQAGQNDGYGSFWIGTSDFASNRVAYFIAFKSDPGNFQVCHTCDNRLCCNPNHLFLGTIADNMQDKFTKDRQAKGEKHGCSKLTQEDVKDIRATYIKRKKGHTGASLARKYGISTTNVCDIVKRKIWKHI